MKKSEIKKMKANQKQVQSHENGQQMVAKQQEENQIKKQVKIQNDQPKKWFEQSNDEEQQIRWNYLQHHAVTFPQPYTLKHHKVMYGTQRVQLTPIEEQLATYWVQSWDTIYMDNPAFKKNFMGLFMERFLREKSTYNKFDKFDFTAIKEYMLKEKQEKSERTKEEKALLKAKREAQAKLYSLAIVDGTIQKLSGYEIEAPTLFKGRGQHPRAGLLKPRIKPQDITINISDQAPIPICPVPGHCWGEVVCKKDITWLCSYKNSSISSSSSHKYVFLAANSRFKQESDRKKYEKARRLQDCIEEIRRNYTNMINDKEIKNKQLGTATYLIDTLALRVGNDKNQDEADTVGCCSLRVEHVELLPQNKLTLSFLGKDSMRYENTVAVIGAVWQNLKIFMRGKEKTEDLFEKIEAQILNDYLKSLMPKLTAKVFRTYNASSTLQKELNKVNMKGLNMEQKLQKYEEANRQVAVLCNHQRTVSKKAAQNLSKKEDFIKMLKQYATDLSKHSHQFSSKKARIDKEDEKIQLDGDKTFVRKFPQSKQATQTLIRKTNEKISKEENQLQKKSRNKAIALGTSKTNYNDPRISVAWCKRNDVKIEKVFTKNLLSKFVWAMRVEPQWQF